MNSQTTSKTDDKNEATKAMGYIMQSMFLPHPHLPFGYYFTEATGYPYSLETDSGWEICFKRIEGELVAEYTLNIDGSDEGRERVHLMKWENMLQFADRELTLLISEYPDKAAEITEFRHKLANGELMPKL